MSQASSPQATMVPGDVEEAVNAAKSILDSVSVVFGKAHKELGIKDAEIARLRAELKSIDDIRNTNNQKEKAWAAEVKALKEDNLRLKARVEKVQSFFKEGAAEFLSGGGAGAFSEKPPTPRSLPPPQPKSTNGFVPKNAGKVVASVVQQEATFKARKATKPEMEVPAAQAYAPVHEKPATAKVEQQGPQTPKVKTPLPAAEISTHEPTESLTPPTKKSLNVDSGFSAGAPDITVLPQPDDLNVNGEPPEANQLVSFLDDLLPKKKALKKPEKPPPPVVGVESPSNPPESVTVSPQAPQKPEDTKPSTGAEGEKLRITFNTSKFESKQKRKRAVPFMQLKAPPGAGTPAQPAEAKKKVTKSEEDKSVKLKRASQKTTEEKPQTPMAKKANVVDLRNNSDSEHDTHDHLQKKLKKFKRPTPRRSKRSVSSSESSRSSSSSPARGRKGTNGNRPRNRRSRSRSHSPKRTGRSRSRSRGRPGRKRRLSRSRSPFPRNKRFRGGGRPNHRRFPAGQCWNYLEFGNCRKGSACRYASTHQGGKRPFRKRESTNGRSSGTRPSTGGGSRDKTSNKKSSALDKKSPKRAASLDRAPPARKKEDTTK